MAAATNEAVALAITVVLDGLAVMEGTELPSAGGKRGCRCGGAADRIGEDGFVEISVHRHSGGGNSQPGGGCARHRRECCSSAGTDHPLNSWRGISAGGRGECCGGGRSK